VKKFLVTFLTLNVLVVAGLIGFLAATGRVDKDKTLTILDLLKHQGTPEKLREQTYEILTKAVPAATSTQPSTMPAVEPESSGSASERLEAAHLSYEAQKLELENRARDLRHRQEMLDAKQVDVQAKLAEVERQRKAFEKEIQQAAGKSHDESFARSLKFYNELTPKQVKNIFLTLPNEGRVDLVAEFLLAMEVDRAGKIISEFKNPDEQKFVTDVLEKIRTATPPVGATTAPASVTASARS
jgi:hypothetical protein